MRILTLVSITVFLVACGDSGARDAHTTVADNDTAGSVDYCTCVNEPLNTDARLKACNDLMNTMTPEETATKAFECRQTLPVPEGGPDLCFCLRTTTRDPELLTACETLIPEDMTPMQLTEKMAACSR